MANQISTKEENTLRTFQQQFDKLRQSSIGKQGKLQTKSKTSLDLKTGETTAEFVGYDRERFQSQLPILRQFILKKDAIRFDAVCDIIINKCPRQELIAWAKEAKKRWDDALADLPSEERQNIFGVSLSVAKAFDRVFYGDGGLFHASPSAQKEDASTRAIIEELLQTAFPRMANALNIIDSVIYWWLDAPHTPVSPVP